MEDLQRQIDVLRNEIERLKKYYDDKLLSLDSDNIVEIDFGRTRLKNPKSLIGKLTTEVLDSDGVATKAWVIENFMPKAGE
jgi:hypothetical protein